MQLKGLKLKDLWWFSLPSIVSSVFEPLASIVDTALIGHKSSHSLAALALSVGIFNAITWVFNFLVHTSTQAVADHEAQNDSSILVQRIKISLFVAVSIGIFCTALLYWPSKFWFSFVGGEPGLWSEFRSYYEPRALFHSFTILSVTVLSILRGFSQLRLVLRLMVFSTTANIFLSWLFLYPLDLGLSGVAYGTVTSHVLVSVVGLFFLFRRKELRENFASFFSTYLPRRQLFRFGKNSSSLFVRSFVLTGCFFISTRLASFIGVKQLASHQILLQVWLLASFFLDGLAISGNILGARYFFAGKNKRTKIIFNQLIRLGVIVGLVFTISYSLFWQNLLALFTVEEELLAILSRLKWPIVLSQLISAIAFVYDGLIFGLDGFGYLAKHMILGGLFFYLPFCFYTLISPDLLWVWLGLIFLNCYRAYSGYKFVSKKVR